MTPQKPLELQPLQRGTPDALALAFQRMQAAGWTVGRTFTRPAPVRTPKR